VVVVGGFGRVGDADTGRFYGEGEEGAEGAEVGGMVNIHLRRK